MTGCRYNAKNTLDKNYLHLAKRLGAQVLAEREVVDVAPIDGKRGATGYTVQIRPSTKHFGKKATLQCKGVIFSGGVLGTVDLMLKLKKTSLPHLSSTLGETVRTNNEALILNTSLSKKFDFSKRCRHRLDRGH